MRKTLSTIILLALLSPANAQNRERYLSIELAGSGGLGSLNFENFQQGTKGGYSQIEFGITANTFENDMIMYVDDIVVEVVQ